MKYPNFARALRGIGTPAKIKDTLGFGRRQVFEYLAGNSLPHAEKLLLHPDLAEAARLDALENERQRKRQREAA